MRAPVGLARTSATVDPMAELPKLAFRRVAVAQCATGVEFGGGALQLRDGTVALTGLGERAARERA